jgi:4-hydroxy-tetrahydrodipicolinate synthase
MMEPRPPERLNCAISTPLDRNLAIDPGRLRAHVDWLDDHGCHEVTLFGTTGEGASFSVKERIDTLEALLARGVAPDRIVLGAIGASITDIVSLCRAGSQAGCRACLVPPPFYFKGVSDTGLHDAFAWCIDALGEDARHIILYHFPDITAVPFSFELIERLRNDFPEVVTGIKDSSGDAQTMRGLLSRFPTMEVRIGAETLLPEAMPLGAAGTISGLANGWPEMVAGLLDGRKEAVRELDGIMAGMAGQHFVAALKAQLAAQYDDKDWGRIRPPLTC